MPASALTRFIKQGLKRGMCPLCRVAEKLDREYVWYFFDEYSDDAAVVDQVRRARGFCADHADQLRRIEVDALKSTLVISTVYEEVIGGWSADLAGLSVDDELSRESCPACANRSNGVAKNARYLLDEIAESPDSRARFSGSVGLCVRHFEIVWCGARRDERALLQEVQQAAVTRLAEDLREHIRKQGDEAKYEPKGAESDAWERALWLTGGWPPESGNAVRRGG